MHIFMTKRVNEQSLLTLYLNRRGCSSKCMPYFQFRLCTTMPSDLAKKKAAKKKEAAKARQRSKKPEELNGEAEQPEAQTNGAESNGENTEVCIFAFFPCL